MITADDLTALRRQLLEAEQVVGTWTFADNDIPAGYAAARLAHSASLTASATVLLGIGDVCASNVLIRTAPEFWQFGLHALVGEDEAAKAIDNSMADHGMKFGAAARLGEETIARGQTHRNEVTLTASEVFATLTYVDWFNHRRHSSLGMLSPIEYELRHANNTARDQAS